MNTYVTGSTIRQLREVKGLTQAELAGMLSVSAKTIRFLPTSPAISCSWSSSTPREMPLPASPCGAQVCFTSTATATA